MHFAVGAGPLTDYIEAIFTKKDLAANVGTHSGYIGINHPDGGGGIDQTMYDWSFSRLFEWDRKTLVVDTDSAGERNVAGRGRGPRRIRRPEPFLARVPPLRWLQPGRVPPTDHRIRVLAVPEGSADPRRDASGGAILWR
jgi:hypothetical protein